VKAVADVNACSQDTSPVSVAKKEDENYAGKENHFTPWTFKGKGV
jgi:hypothetical protein